MYEVLYEVLIKIYMYQSLLFFKPSINIFDYFLKEIVHYKPDVICLQEVDIFEDLSKELLKHGYKGIFEAKPNSPCLQFKVSVE